MNDPPLAPQRFTLAPLNGTGHRKRNRIATTFEDDDSVIATTFESVQPDTSGVAVV